MNARIKAYLRWSLINGIFGVSLYYGLFENVNGALNIALFMAWISAVLGSMILFIESMRKEVIKNFLKEDRVLMPGYIDITFDFVVLLTLLWFNYIWLPIFYACHIIGGFYLRNEYAEWNNKALIEKLKGNMIED